MMVSALGWVGILRFHLSEVDSSSGAGLERRAQLLTTAQAVRGALSKSTSRFRNSLAAPRSAEVLQLVYHDLAFGVPSRLPDPPRFCNLFLAV